MNRLSSLLLLSSLFALLSAGGCNAPGELTPAWVTALDELPGLPDEGACTGDNCCLDEGWCLDIDWLTLRNTGEAVVTIDNIAVVGDDAESFMDASLSTLEVLRDQSTAVHFRYVTPGGAPQSATLVIESDAANSPLEIPLETLEYVPPTPRPDAGTPDSGVADSGTVDSGTVDSGTVDSGTVDSGTVDSGTVDSGTVDSGTVDSGVVDGGALDAGPDAA